MRSILATVMVVSLLGLGTARAEVRTNKAGGVSIDIPSSWGVVDAGARQSKAPAGKSPTGLLSARSKDGAVGLLFWVVDKADAKPALKLLDKALAGKVKDLKWEKPQNANINGLKGIKNIGAATIDGKASFVMVAVVGPTPTKKGVIIFGAIEQAKLTEHKEELQNIFDSLQPVDNK